MFLRQRERKGPLKKIQKINNLFVPIEHIFLAAAYIPSTVLGTAAPGTGGSHVQHM